ncbi:MAG: hypothetical protein M3T55_11850 [Pseudomonadota bacterium]|nr:hypothetical protein [Pseudomonadota bacterium]
MTKAERHDRIDRRAAELARTGRFRDWQEIESQLRFEPGCHEAPAWLDSRSTRDYLDRLCDLARKGQPDA